MSNLKLYFTNEEMVTFLCKKGYSITNIRCWDSHNEYHNRVITTSHIEDIAYNSATVLDELIDSHRNKVKDYSIENVFKKEIKIKLLEL